MSRIIVRDSDLHSHLMARMKQRGITRQEIEDTINSGRIAEDAKEGSLGKTLAFPYNDYWEGKWFEEKGGHGILSSSKGRHSLVYSDSPVREGLREVRREE